MPRKMKVAKKAKSSKTKSVKNKSSFPQKGSKAQKKSKASFDYSAEAMMRLLSKYSNLIKLDPIKISSKIIESTLLVEDYRFLIENAGRINFSDLGIDLNSSAGFDILEIDTPSYDDIPKQFVRYFYQIGISSSGDPIVQIHTGKYRGYIGRIDHEVASLTELISVKNGKDLKGTKYPFKDISTCPNDEVIEFLKSDGSLNFDRNNLSLIQILEKAFSSYNPNFAKYIRIASTTRCIYDAYILPLVNSMKTPQQDTPDDYGIYFLDQTPADYKLINKTYKKLVLPKLDLFAIDPMIFHYLTVNDYWKRAICITFDSYIATKSIEELKVYADALDNFVRQAKKIKRKGFHLLELRVIFILISIGAIDRAVEILERMNFEGHSDEVPSFKKCIQGHPLFRKLANDIRVKKFIDRKETVKGSDYMPYHGSATVEDFDLFYDLVAKNMKECPTK